MDVLMPQLGETVSEGKVLTWFKSVGDQVKAGENLFEIETDKVTMEIQSLETGVLSEIRLLCRSGSARFIVTATPDALGHEVLPHLPLLLLDPSWRNIYINADAQKAAGEAFSLQMPKDPQKWAAELETLRAFHFDVVTVDLTGNAENWASTALDVASVAFLLWPSSADRRPAWEAGIRWELALRQDGGRLDWSLEPLHF